MGIRLIEYHHSSGVIIPLEKVCEHCSGIGRAASIYMHGVSLNESSPCKHCHGSGKVWIYYTPKEIEKMTGEPLLEDTAVWVYLEIENRKDIVRPGPDSPENSWSLFYYRNNIPGSMKTLIAFPFQPRPLKDWKPEQLH